MPVRGGTVGEGDLGVAENYATGNGGSVRLSGLSDR